MQPTEWLHKCLHQLRRGTVALHSHTLHLERTLNPTTNTWMHTVIISNGTAIDYRYQCFGPGSDLLLLLALLGY